jgi:hypothetical protein
VSGVLGRMGLWASYGWMVAIRPTSQQYRPERSIASPITPQIRSGAARPGDPGRRPDWATTTHSLTIMVWHLFETAARRGP